MRAWLIDTYRTKKQIVLWLKTPEENIRLVCEHRPTFFVEDAPLVRNLLTRANIAFVPVEKKTCLLERVRVLRMQTDADAFLPLMRSIEQKTRHRVQLYNIDIPPEMQFLYDRDVQPLCLLETEPLTMLEQEPAIPLTQVELHINPGSRCNPNEPIREIRMGEKVFLGDERALLERFAHYFHRVDPDVIIAEQGFLRVPHLAARLEHCGISCALHRWDPTPISYRGGRSFFTYGQIIYRDYALRLHGRFLIDTYSTLGNFIVDGLVELCQLSGARLQHVASRSSGAIFQMTLLRDVYKEGLLIPYKQLPQDIPRSMTELVKADRAGHTMDPLTGFHKDVAEIDFVSMYPWLMYNRNISAEQVKSDAPPFEYAPGLPIRISLARKGFVPRAIKPFLDRRVQYKRNPTRLNNAKAKALKTVLVSANGYLRFREFKLGLASSHMALCAWARETLLQAQHLAQEHGYCVIHGIIDSMYIQREGIEHEEVKGFCEELEQLTGIPLSFPGIFKWVVFLTSTNDDDRPVPARYYGVYRNGEIKARGIEVRQRGSPQIVRQFQQECLEYLASCDEREQILAAVDELGRMLRAVISRLATMPPELLARKIRVSKEEYKHDVPQRQILQHLRRQGVETRAGQAILFIHTRAGAVEPRAYKGDVDVDAYTRLLTRALYILLQPFGFSRTDVDRLARTERQLTLTRHKKENV